MKIFRLTKIIIEALNLSFYRFKLDTYVLELYLKRYKIGYPADWIGLFLFALFYSMVSTGISVEKPFLLNNILVLNVYSLIVFNFFVVISSSLLIRRYISPNISILVERIPIPPFKTHLLNLFIEVFDYKIVIIILQLIMILIFNIYYGLSNAIGHLLIIYIIVFIAYIFTCQMAFFIKKLARNRVKSITQNKIRLILLIATIPLFVLSENNDLKIGLSYSYLTLLFIVLGLNFIFFIFIRSINLSK